MSECEQFEAHYPIGTRARLAYELLLQAGQSKCDVVRMGRQHIRKGVMTMRRQKTGVPSNVEITSRVQAAIDAIPESNYLTFRSGIRKLLPRLPECSSSSQQPQALLFDLRARRLSARGGMPLL
jgi:hypothetical protein